MSKNNGGPAFPTLAVMGDIAASEGGMTLRDYFAAKAMQGAMASFINGIPANAETDTQLAKASYLIADAMLAEREKASG